MFLVNAPQLCLQDVSTRNYYSTIFVCSGSVIDILQRLAGEWDDSFA